MDQCLSLPMADSQPNRTQGASALLGRQHRLYILPEHLRLWWRMLERGELQLWLVEARPPAEHTVYSRMERKVEPVAKQINEPIAALHEPVLPPKARDTPTSLVKRSSIPYLPGNLFCPQEAGNLNQTTDTGAGETVRCAVLEPH
jgi:hypothetical protein